MSLPSSMRASSAEPGNMKVAKLMHFETNMARLASDVEKLMNISAQHGMKIKELIVAAANSVSQVEFMSAITTTRFQNLNVAKTMKSDKQEGQQETSHSKASAASAAAAAMQEEMKTQISQLENEIFNQNFKSGMDLKKAENENRIRQKEIAELKSHIRSLEQKLEKFAEAVEAGGIQTNIKFAPPPADPNRRKQSVMIFSDDLEEDDTRNALSASHDVSESKERKEESESSSAAVLEATADISAARTNIPMRTVPDNPVDPSASFIHANQLSSHAAADSAHHYVDPNLASSFHPGIASNPLPASLPPSTPPTITAERIRRMSLARLSSPHTNRLSMHTPPLEHTNQHHHHGHPKNHNHHSHGHGHAEGTHAQPHVHVPVQHFPAASSSETQHGSGGGASVVASANAPLPLEANHFHQHPSINQVQTFAHASHAPMASQEAAQFLQMPVWNPPQQPSVGAWGGGMGAPHSGGGAGHGTATDESDIDVEMICHFICTQMQTMKMVEQISSQLASDAIGNIIKKVEKHEGRNHNGKVVIERMIQTDTPIGSTGVLTAAGGSPRRRSSVVKLVDSKRSSFFSNSFMSQFNDGDSVGGGNIGGGSVGGRDRGSVANLLLDFQNNLSTMSSSVPFQLSERPASKDRRKAISRQSSIRKSILRNEGIEVVYSVDPVVPAPAALIPESSRKSSATTTTTVPFGADLKAVEIASSAKFSEESTVPAAPSSAKNSPTLSPTLSIGAAEGKKGSPVVSGRKGSSKAAETRKNSSRKNSGSNQAGRKASAPPPVARHPSVSQQPSAPLDYISDHSLDLHSNQPSLVLANSSVDTPPGQPSQPVAPITSDLTVHIRSPSVDISALEKDQHSEQQEIPAPLATQPSQSRMPVEVLPREGSNRHLVNMTSLSSQSRQASYRDQPIEDEPRGDQEASQEEKMTELVYIEPLTIEDIEEDDPDYNVYGDNAPVDPEQALKRFINETIENKMFALCNHVNVRFQVLSDAINQHMFHHIDTLYQKVTAMQEYIYKYSYPNFKDLINQYNDLVDRVNELETWDEALLGPLQMSVEKYREEIDEIRQTVEDFIATHDQDNHAYENVQNIHNQIKSSIVVDMEAVDNKVQQQKELFLSVMSSPSHPKFPDGDQAGEVNVFEMDAATKQLKHYAMLCEDIYGQHVQLSQRLNKMESRYRISQNKHYSDGGASHSNSPSRAGRATVSHSTMEFPSSGIPGTPSTQGRSVRPSTSASTPAKHSHRIAFTDDLSAPNTPSLSRSQHIDIINIMGNEMKSLKYEVETLKKALQEQVMTGMARKVSHKTLKKAGADATTISNDSLVFPVPPTPGTPNVYPKHLLEFSLDKSHTGSSRSVHPQPPSYPKSSVVKEFGNPLLNPARAKHTLSAGSSRNEELSKELPVKKSVWYEPSMGGGGMHLDDSMHSHNSTLSSDFYQLLRSSDRTVSNQKVVSHGEADSDRPEESSLRREYSNGLVEDDFVSDKSLREITK